MLRTLERGLDALARARYYPEMAVKRPAPDDREAAFLALPRNDVAACVRFYKRFGVDADEAASMLWLMDDRRELERTMQSWKIRPRPSLTGLA